MKIQSSNKDYSRNTVFPLKISKREKEFLIQEAGNQGKSMATLIREGKLKNVKVRKVFSKI